MARACHFYPTIHGIDPRACPRCPPAQPSQRPRPASPSFASVPVCDRQTEEGTCRLRDDSGRRAAALLVSAQECS